jgi:hypothetical protein
MATTARYGVPRAAVRDLRVGIGIAAVICGVALCAASLALEETAPPSVDRTPVRTRPVSAPMSSPSDAPAWPAADIVTAAPTSAAVPFADLYAGQGLWLRSNVPGSSTSQDEDPRAYLGQMAALGFQRRLSPATTRDPYQASLNPAVYGAGAVTPTDHIAGNSSDP